MEAFVAFQIGKLEKVGWIGQNGLILRWDYINVCGIEKQMLHNLPGVILQVINHPKNWGKTILLL